VLVDSLNLRMTALVDGATPVFLAMFSPSTFLAACHLAIVADITNSQEHSERRPGLQSMPTQRMFE